MSESLCADLRAEAQYLRDGCDNVGEDAKRAALMEAAADEIERIRADFDAYLRRRMSEDYVRISRWGAA